MRWHEAMPCPLCQGPHELSQCPRWRVPPVKAALALAAIALALAWLGFTFVRAGAASPQSGRDMVGYALLFVSAILLLIAAAKVAAP